MPLRPRTPLDDSWLFQDPMTLELVEDGDIPTARAPHRKADRMTRLPGLHPPETSGSTAASTRHDPIED